MFWYIYVSLQVFSMCVCGLDSTFQHVGGEFYSSSQVVIMSLIYAVTSELMLSLYMVLDISSIQM